MNDAARFRDSVFVAEQDDARQALQNELIALQPVQAENPFAVPERKPNQDQDKRAIDLIVSLNDPRNDMGRLIDKLRNTFASELNANGVVGAKELAYKVQRATGLSLSVEPFRGGRLMALYIKDRNGRSYEIPLSGR